MSSEATQHHKGREIPSRNSGNGIKETVQALLAMLSLIASYTIYKQHWGKMKAICF